MQIFIILDAYDQIIPIYTPASNVCKLERDYIEEQIQTKG